MSKKGAKAATKAQSYEYGDIVLAKIRGYPSWPSQVSIITVLSPFAHPQVLCIYNTQ